MGAIKGSEGRILFVEDEPDISEAMTRQLQRAGFDVTTARTVKETRGILEHDALPDLVLLDLGLPDDSQGGLVLASEIRGRDGRVPIVIFSADSTDESRQMANKLGAWGFIVKGTVSGETLITELKSKLEIAHMIQSRSTDEALEPIDIGGLHVDFDRYEATIDGERMMLSHKEFELLRRLLVDAGKVVTREALMADVWDENWFGSTKTLDVHIGWLRRKLNDDPTEPKYLFTVRGVGFRFASAEEAAA
ncbi:MAG: response regulator transcription factor [Solirubrobacterales bacterium]|nr:response regulator transcription factor [Solirubrobacterales bacterium]